MDVIAQYHAAITTMLQKIVDTQKEAIATAARRCADAIAEDRYLYVIGTGGHSAIAPQEMFWRAGGLVPGEWDSAADTLAYDSPRGTVRMAGNHLVQSVYLARTDGLDLDVVAQLAP